MKKRNWLVLPPVAIVMTFVCATFWYEANQEKQNDSSVLMATELLIRPYSPSIGPENAPVTVVEFLDPECETCAKMYPVVKKLLNEFPGRVRLVVRYATFHEHSAYVSLVLEAARQQGKYWEALDLIFSKHAEWASHDSPRPDLLYEYMGMLDLNRRKMEEEFQNAEIQAHIEQDSVDAAAVAIEYTPTFFVNGKKVSKPEYDEIRSAIILALSHARTLTKK